MVGRVLLEVRGLGEQYGDAEHLVCSERNWGVTDLRRSELLSCGWVSVAEPLSTVLKALNPLPVLEREGKRAADPRSDILPQHRVVSDCL